MMTIPGEIQTGIRPHAEGRRFLGGGHRAAVGPSARASRPAASTTCSTLQGALGGTLKLRVVRGADERTVHVVITPDIEDQ